MVVAAVMAVAARHLDLHDGGVRRHVDARARRGGLAVDGQESEGRARAVAPRRRRVALGVRARLFVLRVGGRAAEREHLGAPPAERQAFADLRRRVGR